MLKRFNCDDGIGKSLQPDEVNMCVKSFVVYTPYKHHDSISK